MTKTEAKQGERKAIFFTPKTFERFKALKEKERRTHSAQLEVLMDLYYKYKNDDL